MASSAGVSTKAYPIFSRIRNLKEVMSMLSSLKRYSESEVAQKKMEIINFYDEFGEKATVQAFGADRKVISRWKKRLWENGGRLASLVPYPTKPKRTRTVAYDQKIVDFIKEIRVDHPRLGKEKIKIDLDEYCLREGLRTVSESTIGNIIKRHKLFFQKQGRTYHDPASAWAQKRVHKKKRLRVKHPPKLDDFGHIQSDAVQRITDGIRDYFISAIDAKMKFTLTLNYKSLSSRNNKDFYQRFKSVYPGKIVDWQSDNGSENLGEFDQVLEQDQIPHLFSYPRCPKINTYIERYNRTLQEEFIDNNLDIIHDKILFNQKLSEYLIWYNTKRPHKSLGLKSPLQYLIEKGGMSQKSLTYTILLTNSIPYSIIFSIMTSEAPRPRPNDPREPLQPREPIKPVAPLGQGAKFLPGENLPELDTRRRRQRLSEDLSPEERAEIIENRMLADEVNKERQSWLMRTYGKTENDLEADADALLRAAGFDDLVEGKEERGDK